jgi:uncharacterized protein YjhX (UPF0386 family)
MDFTPGERAVLSQIRVLYKEAGRDQQVKALMMQWPPTHHDSYRNAYTSLVAKRLIQDIGAQAFRITDAGLKAMGVTPPAAQPQPTRVERQSVQQVHPQVATKPRRSAFSRLMRGLLGARG